MTGKKVIESFKKTDFEILKRLPKWQQKLHRLVISAKTHKKNY